MEVILLILLLKSFKFTFMVDLFQLLVEYIRLVSAMEGFDFANFVEENDKTWALILALKATQRSSLQVY